MGLGRREFVKLVSLALAGTALDPLDAIAVNDNLYINKKLGILFSKPLNWGFVAVKDFGKLKEAQKIGVGLDQSEDEIWDALCDPICIATKYYQDRPEYYGIFSPTITLNITPKSEFEDLEFESVEDMMEMSAYGTAQLLNGFKILKKHNPIIISNCKFYEYDAEYLFEHTEIKHPLRVELKTLTVEHNGFYYDFNFHQSKAQNQTAEKEFKEFISSIKLI